MSKLSQRQELQQKLSPQQILQASLLQLNAQLLEQRILQEVELNPALELLESDDGVENLEENVEETDDIVDESDFEWEELMGDPDEFEIRAPKDLNQEHNEMPLRMAKTINDKFMEQLRDINASKIELNIAEQILGNLDDHGYLNIEPMLISDRMLIKEEEVLRVMKKIRNLDPPGFASQNMRECLIAQLEKFRDNDIAKEILEKYFNDFAQRKYEKIMDKVGCSKNSLQEAITVISQLNPHPGSGVEYSDKDFVIPDICIEKNNDGWQITSNDSSLPPLRISKSYKRMLKDYKDDTEVKHFVKQKLDSAKWFIDAIDQRKDTIIRVMEAIINRQKEYFDSDDRMLQPMILKDIANDIRMDISTVSRVTNGRYAQLPWEIKELKTFFSEGITTKKGGMVSNKVLKDRIHQIIKNENKQKPLGDEKIVAILIKEGFKIARRTVTKYRENLKIPVARLRREL